MPREKIILACEECKRRNYVVTKNRGHKPGRVAYRKFCARCQRHTTHQETR